MTLTLKWTIAFGQPLGYYCISHGIKDSTIFFGYDIIVKSFPLTFDMAML
jgi:hypothetical protein